MDVANLSCLNNYETDKVLKRDNTNDVLLMSVTVEFHALFKVVQYTLCQLIIVKNHNAENLTLLSTE